MSTAAWILVAVVVAAYLGYVLASVRARRSRGSLPHEPRNPLDDVPIIDMLRGSAIPDDHHHGMDGVDAPHLPDTTHGDGH
jgi:hypothetical protein